MATAVGLVGATLYALASPAAAATLAFAPAVNFAVGGLPGSVAVGDFNGDTKPDLAVANDNSNTVSVLLGDGTGGFAPAVNFAAGSGPRSVAVGDFNGDGKADLAVANSHSNNVSVLLGNGAGGFAPAVNFATGVFPQSVAVGDFNGDGKADLAVANSDSNNFSVLLGNGAGGFAPAVNFVAGASPGSVAVGDFNGDTKADLAVANIGSDNVSVLLGNGAGGFAPAVNFATGVLPQSVAVGDFNGDAKADLAVPNFPSNNVSVLLGNGAGGFAPAQSFAVGSAPRSVAVGDFNGDGKADLAVANSGSDNVSVLLGDGAGDFAPPVNFAVGSIPRSVAVGDFNGDAKPDLVVGNAASNNVSVLLNQSTSPATISGTPPAGTVGVAYSFAYTTSNATDCTLTGTLAAGLNFTAGTCTIAGTPTAAGSFPISVVANGAGANSAPDGSTLTVAPASQAITFTSTAPTNPSVGATYTPTATGGSSGNPVTFSIAAGSSSVCSLGAANLVTFNAPGSCVIQANQAGNADFSAAPQVTQTVTVTRASPTIATQASAGNLLGAPVHDTATLSGGASPTGTVTFRLFSDAACGNQGFTSTNLLAGGTATSDTFTPAAATTYYWMASYLGDANNNAVISPCRAPNESVVIAPFTAPTPTRTITGDLVGPVTVNAGESVLLTNARVVGPITVNPGGALSVVNSQISRGIVANAPSFFSVCGSQVSGPSTTPGQGIVVSNAAVPIRIGDPAAGCAANRVAGDVVLTANSAGLTLGSNTVSGSVTVNNNTVGTDVVKANNISGVLGCTGNAPVPTNAGQTNTAGSKSGQCSAL